MESFGHFVRDSMGSNIFLCVLLLAVTSNLSSLADFSLTCSPPVPTCPGTVVNCECEGAVGSLTWNITTVEGASTSCIISYIGIESKKPLEDNCNAVTAADVSRTIQRELFVFNSSLSINLTGGIMTVSCEDNIGDSMKDHLHLASRSNTC